MKTQNQRIGAIVLLMLGLLAILVGILSHIDYSSAGTQLAHSRSMTIVGIGFCTLVLAAWLSGMVYETSKLSSLFVLVTVLALVLFFFTVFA
jgi:hypothetical protein